MNFSCVCGARYRVRSKATTAECPLCRRINEAVRKAGPDIDWRLLFRRVGIVVVGLLPALAVYVLFFTGTNQVQNAEAELRPAERLKKFAEVSAKFRSSDLDGNGRTDYWVGDVSGLFRLAPSGKELELIELADALADGHRLAADPERVPFKKERLKDDASQSRWGYYFQVMDGRIGERGRREPYHKGNARNISHFGFIAYPESHAPGRVVYVIDERGAVYSIDPGAGGYVAGAPPRARLAALDRLDFGYMPLDPQALGWSKMK